MKTTSGLSILALVAALASGPALAGDATNLLNDTVDSVQGTVSGVTGGVEGTVDGMTGDTSSDVDGGDVTGSIGDSSVGDVGTFSDFINDFSAGNFSNDVSDISDVSDVSVVNVQDAFQDFDSNAFNDALSGNSTQVADLQNALSNNSALNDYLSGNDISVSDVVALDNNQDGSLVIYTNSDD